MVRCFLQRGRLWLLVATGARAMVISGEASSIHMGNRFYEVTRWTAENGLPGNTVKSVAQTKDGYLWIGTMGGLARFDGVSLKVFNHDNTPELTRPINDLVADTRDASLWLTIEGDLLRVNRNGFQRFSLRKDFPGCSGVLRPARDGGVWFFPRAGQLALLRDEKIKSWTFAIAQKENLVRDLAEVGPTQVLLVIPWSLYRFDLNTQACTPVALAPKPPDCFSVTSDAQGEVLLSTGTGLWQGTDGRWTEVARQERGPVGSTDHVLKTSDGLVWIARNGQNRSSLQVLVDGRIELFGTPEFPTDATITRLIEDREGNLWVATTSGLIRVQSKHIRVYSRQDGLASDNTLAVTMRADGALCVGTVKGLSLIEKGNIANIGPPSSEPAWHPLGVFLADADNALWAGWNEHFLVRLKDHRWKSFPALPELGNADYLRALYKDKEGRLWIGTGEGAFCQSGKQWLHFCTTNGLSHNDVRLIYQDRIGDMWLGTLGGGLNRFHEGKLSSYKTRKSDYNNHMWWIHEDGDGVFWVGSEDGLNRFIPPGVRLPTLTGSSRIGEARTTRAVPGSISEVSEPREQDRFFTFTTRQGLRENVINNIQEDDFGYLWLSGLRGVCKVSRQELNEVAAGVKSQVHCISYGEADGMLSSECNGGDNQPSGCKDREGRIWFPTTLGVAVFDPRERCQSEIPPAIVIDEVNADGEALLPVSREARIKPGKAHVLEFRYTANTFIAPERAQFRYRLIGAEDKWIDAGAQRSVRYINLRPGKYEFDVMAANHHGVWNQQGAQFRFSLEPHFWQTATFYSLCVVAAVGLGALIQGYRLKWQHRLLKLEEQRALANERTRIARDLHDDLGTALTGLALQLEVAQRAAKDKPAVADRVSQTAEKARDLARRMREVVWTINPRCDTVAGLASFLEQEVSQFAEADGMKMRINFPEDIPATPLGAKARHELALSIREALTNVVRHAQATEVVVSLEIANDQLLVQVKDNGRGFRPADNPGHGLGNMQTRIELVGGKFECVSAPGQGTVLRFFLPTELPRTREQI